MRRASETIQGLSSQPDLQGADSLPASYHKPQGFSVMPNLAVTEADTIFNAPAR